MNKLKAVADHVMIIVGNSFHFDVVDWEDFAFEGWEEAETLGFRLIRRA